MQGNQHFETDAEAGKPGCCIVFTDYCILFQKSFHLPFSLFKRTERNNFFAGENVCSDKLELDEASYRKTQGT